jgi:hypothetical protein
MAILTFFLEDGLDIFMESNGFRGRGIGGEQRRGESKRTQRYEMKRFDTVHTADLLVRGQF